MRFLLAQRILISMSERSLSDQPSNFRSSESTFAEDFPTWKHKVGFVAGVATLTLVSVMSVNLVTTGDPLNRDHGQPHIEEPIK